MNFANLFVMAFGLMIIVVGNSESMLNSNGQLKLCGPQLVKTIQHICDSYENYTAAMHVPDENVEKPHIASLCCLKTCSANDILNYCHSGSVIKANQTASDEPKKFEPQLMFNSTSNTYDIRYIDIAMDENPKGTGEMENSTEIHGSMQKRALDPSFNKEKLSSNCCSQYVFAR